MARFNSVSWKFLGILIPTLALSAVVILALYSYVRFVYAEGELHKLIEGFLDVHNEAIAQPLWTLDRAGLEKNMRTLAAHKVLECVEVIEKVGVELSSVHSWPFDCQASGMATLKKSREVIYNEQRVGRLTVFYTKEQLITNLKKEVLIGTLFFFLVASIVGIVAFGALQSIVGRPLASFVKSINRAERENLRVPIAHAPRDELGSVVDAYNQLIQQVDDYTQELVDARVVAESLAETKSRFLATMSHELRTPLSAVIGINEMLREEIAEDGGDTEPYDRIAGSGRHLLKSIDDILDYSQLDSKKVQIRKENIFLSSVLDELTPTAMLLAEKNNNTFELICPEQPVILHTNPTRLRQVIINLLGNAFKFTRQGAVSLEITEKPESEIQFIVRDTGIGISKDQLGRLFDEFYQTDETTTRQHGGVGLGLSIAQQLCQLLGGKIEVISEIGAGSEFSFTLATTPLEMQQ